MRCKKCGAELVRCKTSNENRYKCPNGDCPVLFARKRRNNGEKEWEWIYEAQAREVPL